MKIIIIIIAIILFILLMPIGIRIIHNDNRSDVDLYFYKLFNYRLDLDEFIKLFITEKKDRKKIKLRTIINNLEISIKTRKILYDAMGVSKVLKSTILLKENYDNIFTFISYWNLCSYFSSFINAYFKKVKNEYYMTSNSKKELCFELIIEIRLIKLIYVMLKDLNEVVKAIKIKRRQKKNGKSYL